MSSNAPRSSCIAAVSVIIPAFNEAKHISQTLEALCAQSLRAEMFEVIVVDNGSTDDTVAIATGFSERLSLRVVVKTGCRIAALRNHGALLATGEVLAFLDADCIAPESWLEDSLTVQRPQTVWGAHYLVPIDSTWVGRIWFKYQATPQEGPTSFLPGGNLFMQRGAFLALAGFGEELETSEDVELCQRARHSGMAVVAFQALAVHHEGTPRTLRHFYRQNRWHGTTVLRNFFANLPATANLPLVCLSLYTFFVFWAALLFVVSLPWTHLFKVSLLLPCLLLLPPVLLTLAKVIKKGKGADAAPLFTLYLTYLLARAASLTKLSGRNHR